MIETSKRSSWKSGYVGFFGENEIGVSEILLDLAKLISDSEWRRHFPTVCWGKKRKRSVLDSASATTATASTSPPVQAEKERCVVKVKKTKNKNVDSAAVFLAAAATSPSTPLAFPTSESDEHKSSKQSNSKKRTKEELLEIIDGLSHQKELLKGELIAMRSKLYKLSTTNLELKAKKQEISCYGQKPEKKPQLGMNGEHYQYQMTMFAPRRPTGNFQDIYGQRTPMGTTPSYHGIGPAYQMSPRGIPDLNVCVEENACVLGAATSQPLDMMRMLMMNSNNRFRAADARRRRMMKIKEAKNQGRSQSQSQHPHGPLSF